MFLDEELKQIWETETDKTERANKIYKACVSRIDGKSQDGFVTSIRRVDNSFRLFAKQTCGVNPNWLKQEFIGAIKQDEYSDVVLRSLGWDK